MAARVKDKGIEQVLQNQKRLSDCLYARGRYANFEPPVEIDLTDVFDREIRIKTSTQLSPGDSIGVDIQISRYIYSVVGRVEKTRADGGKWWSDLVLEYVPSEMLLEIEELSTLDI